MDYYGSMRHDYIQKEMYPTENRMDYFPKGALAGSNVKIVPKPECVPRFVSKIEGNAVEEGDRVFFEGIIDAQPMPVFSWFFNDEPVIPGQPGWEDAEVHESRKMSTLILKYAREYHMGKYTLVAENHLGHAISNCDLIVRKKQFPPVFWQRLYNYEAEAGSRLVAEVEVGGWPVPTVTWFKDEEVLTSKTHTENYNGYPNRYVPDSRIEVIRIDQIRHCVIFHRISEMDSGIYTVQAVNPLGEAVCEAEFIVGPGEGGAGDLYIPEKWKTGNRLDWLKEDQRAKRYENVDDPLLSDEERAAMFKRFARPLPRALEYLASLPDYYPKPWDQLPQIPYKSEASDVRRGKQGGKPSRPSKFVSGKIAHNGYKCDTGGRIPPWWFNQSDPNARDPDAMHYKSVRPLLKEPRPQPPFVEGPPCPHEWESHETIEALYKMLDKVGCKMEYNHSNLSSTGKKDKKTVQKSNSNTSSSIQQKSQVKKFSYLQSNEETKETTVTKTDASSHATVDEHYEEMRQYASNHEQMSLMSAPALPPKTKIMNSPSRHLFSPTSDITDGVDSEYCSVKEKAKMIALQQEEIVRREEIRKKAGDVPPPGGIRILPPSPITVRKEVHVHFDDMAEQKHMEMKQWQMEQQLESQRLEEQQIQEQQQVIKQRILDEQQEQQRILKEQQEKQRILKEQQEQQRILKEQQEQQRILNEQQSILKEQQEQQRILKEQQEKQRLLKQQEQQKLLKQQQEKLLAQQKEEQLRLVAEKEEQQRQHQLEQQRLLEQQQEQRRLREIEEQRLEQERQEQLRLREIEEERLQQERQGLTLLDLEKEQLRIKEQEEQIRIQEQHLEQLRKQQQIQLEQLQEQQRLLQVRQVVKSESANEVMYEATASTRMIPRLEDKYDVATNLEELASTHSDASSFASSSKMTQQSAYSSMSSSSMMASSVTSSSSKTTVVKQASSLQSSSVSSIKTVKDSSYSTASSELEAPSWLRTRNSIDESPVQFGSPSTKRRMINQSPSIESEQSPKYRTPPSTPFQPGFYKKPQSNPEEASNLFPLSPKLRKEKSSDSIGSTSSKKLRRKKIEAQRLEMSDDESDPETFKELTQE